MARGERWQDLVDLTFNGVEAAKRTWDRMSGMSLDYAPEYFVTTHIGNSISRGFPKGHGWVYLEGNFKEVVDEAGGCRQGRRHALFRPKGRFDAAVYYKNGYARAVIEVKHPTYSLTHGMRTDMGRVCAALHSNKAKGKLQLGLLAFYASCAAPLRGKETAAGRLRRLVVRSADAACDIARKHRDVIVERPRSRVHHFDDRGAWVAAVIIFRRERPRARAA